MEILKQLERVKSEAAATIAIAKTPAELADVKALYFGKKGSLAEVMAEMKNLAPAERPAFGAIVNEAKNHIGDLIQKRQTEIETAIVNEKLAREAVDVTMPSRRVRLGTPHLLNQVIEEIEDLFIGMGYSVKEGPEVESDLYNFEMLNLPKSHPARDMQDTFYITEELLLCPQTAPVQVRTLLANTLHQPVKIICPGKVYRRDDDDMTHSHQFTQVEGLVVDDKTTIGDLKGTLLMFAKKMFGAERQIRMRPSFFPFTEPSVEVDVSCYKCGGVGCPMCKHTGWIEILGAGMVNNNVLAAAGYDPTKFQGFAFGMGVERIAILKHGIDDIRHFYTNDLRFNRQFR